MKDFVGRWRDVLMRIGTLPVSFLGVGLYRAWLSTFFRYEAFPTVGFFDYALFEGAIGVASLRAPPCAALAQQEAGQVDRRLHGGRVDVGGDRLFRRAGCGA